MKRFLPFVLMLLALNAKSQVISRFTWDSNPVTKAAVGPDAISVSGSATSSVNGVGGTNGLNPGTPATDINLTLTGSYFDVPGLDIAVSFRREENEASFFRRGSNFNFGMSGGNLSASFLVSNGAGGSVALNSGAVYAIPNDHAFHHYHFRYISSTGNVTIWVDGTVVYNFTATAGRPMYWTGAGNAVIGYQMDATGRNLAVLDNMIIQNSAAPLTLPVQLLSFTAQQKNVIVQLNWSTSREINASGFEVEHSVDGSNFVKTAVVSAAGGFSIVNKYQSVHTKPAAGINYYRIRMADIDGKFTYSDIQKLNIGNGKTSVSVFPNPATDNINIQVSNSVAASYTYQVFNMDGKLLISGNAQLAAGTQQIRINLNNTTQKGILAIQLKNNSANTSELLRVLKN